MSAPQFTPGPWRVREPGFATVLGMKRHTHVDGSFTDFEAEIARIQPSPKREANARLIAAAPELYEAARLFVEEYDAADDDDGTATMIAYDTALQAARAALAKARGEA